MKQITDQEYLELRRAKRVLDWLNEHGVDNWEGYSLPPTREVELWILNGRGEIDLVSTVEAYDLVDACLKYSVKHPGRVQFDGVPYLWGYQVFSSKQELIEFYGDAWVGVKKSEHTKTLSPNTEES